MNNYELLLKRKSDKIAELERQLGEQKERADVAESFNINYQHATCIEREDAKVKLSASQDRVRVLEAALKPFADYGEMILRSFAADGKEITPWNDLDIIASTRGVPLMFKSFIKAIAALSGQAKECPFVKCAVCVKDVCPIEDCKQHQDGYELNSGDWVCSSTCWDKATADGQAKEKV